MRCVRWKPSFKVVGQCQKNYVIICGPLVIEFHKVGNSGDISEECQSKVNKMVPYVPEKVNVFSVPHSQMKALDL